MGNLDHIETVKRSIYRHASHYISSGMAEHIAGQLLAELENVGLVLIDTGRLPVEDPVQQLAKRAGIKKKPPPEGGGK